MAHCAKAEFLALMEGVNRRIIHLEDVYKDNTRLLE